MSPLLIDHHILIDKQQIRLASTSQLSRKLLFRQRAGTAAAPDVVLARLQELLMQVPQGQFKQDAVHLYLGAPWVRYISLPWQDSLKKDSDWESYARIVFGQQFGVSADNWRIRIAQSGYGRPALAAAMEEGLYQTLFELCRSGGFKLGRCEPWFISAINQHAGRLKGGELALLVLEAGHVTVGFYREKAWHGVVNLIRPDADRIPGTAQLAAMLREAAMLSGQPLPETAYLVSSDATLQSGHSGDCDFEWLGPAHPRFNTGESEA